MAIGSLSCLLPAFLLLLVESLYAAVQELPVQLISGNRAVVHGTAAGGHELAMLVDTGAECTVIGTGAAQQMQLSLLPQTIEYVAFGKIGHAPLAVVRDLRVGPIFTSLACVVGDIPTGGIDMILGLNVLGKHNFGIDYERRKIVFDPPDRPSVSVPFESDAGLVVVTARVHGERIRMLVDTGAATHCVFQDGPILWLLNDQGHVTTTPHMGHRSESREVSLKALTVGSVEWKSLKAMAISSRKPALWDAVLSVGSLGLKTIYFDFERRLLSWTK